MIPTSALKSMSQLFAAFRGGSTEAAGRIVELLYPELRRLAASKMRRERKDHTWQPTELVNELYLQLVQSKPVGGDGEVRNERNAFFGLAGHLMMRLLIQHARPVSRRAEKVTIDDIPGLLADSEEKLREVELLLEDLASIDPELRTLVEMKVFEGLSIQEIATRLDRSVRTVERRWTFARHWLAEELG
jgi:RNA polymerase sigma factor (TIGR02999 family)